MKLPVFCNLVHGCDLLCVKGRFGRQRDARQCNALRVTAFQVGEAERE